MNEVTAFDTEGTDNDKYYVVTLYNVGKSGPSNVASVVSTDINNVTTNATSDNTTFIYTTSGVLVGNNVSTLPAGSYIVKQGNKKNKIVVR